MSETKAAEALASAANLKSFQPALFGYACVSQNHALHSEIVKALLAAVEDFANKASGPYDPINFPYYALCANIRDMVIEQYGYYPGVE